MLGSSVERWKSGLTLALGIYPIFVGLYAAGFFWSVPRDIIGAFGIDEFLFRSSVLYSMLLGGILIPLLLLSSVYAVIVGNKDQAEVSESVADGARYLKWVSASRGERVRLVLVSLAIIVLVSVSLYLEPMPLGSNPDGFLTWLLILSVAGVVARPFIDDLQWKVAVLLYALAWLVGLPLVVGYNDAKPEAGAPAFAIQDRKCPVVLVGKDALLAKCGSHYVLIRADQRPQSLVWSNPPEKRH